MGDLWNSPEEKYFSPFPFKFRGFAVDDTSTADLDFRKFDLFFWMLTLSKVLPSVCAPLAGPGVVRGLEHPIDFKLRGSIDDAASARDLQSWFWGTIWTLVGVRPSRGDPSPGPIPPRFDPFEGPSISLKIRGIDDDLASAADPDAPSLGPFVSITPLECPSVARSSSDTFWSIGRPLTLIRSWFSLRFPSVTVGLPSIVTLELGFLLFRRCFRLWIGLSRRIRVLTRVSSTDLFELKISLSLVAISSSSSSSTRSNLQFLM